MMQMHNCEKIHEDMLPLTVVHLEIEDAERDFDYVMEAATLKAGEYDNAPKLVSWFDRKRLACFPNTDCCAEGNPEWLAHAKAQGADLTIHVNQGEYIFIFRESHGLP